MRLGFQAAHATLANFLSRIGGQKEPFLKSDEQPENPPEIRHIARQIHAELGHPQQSAREKRLEESARNAAASLGATMASLNITENGDTLKANGTVSEQTAKE